MLKAEDIESNLLPILHNLGEILGLKWDERMQNVLFGTRSFFMIKSFDSRLIQ